MSLKMACWEQPVARETFPRVVYQVSSCALEQPAVLNTAGSLVETCWKTSTCNLWFRRGLVCLYVALIYNILRGPRLQGNDYSVSYFMHRHICTTTHLRARMPREDEICVLFQTNKPSLASERTPRQRLQLHLCSGTKAVCTIDWFLLKWQSRQTEERNSPQC